MCYFAFRTSHVSASRIGRIDSSKIKNSAEPFVKMRDWFEDQCHKTQSDLTQKVNELQKTYEWLKVAQQNKKNLKKNEDFRQDVAKLETLVQSQKDKLSKQFNLISGHLEEKLKQIIAEISKKKNISVVMNQYIQDVQAILYYDDSVLDITDEVIRRLNEDERNILLPDLESLP